MANQTRRRIWSTSDAATGAPLNREIQVFGKEGERVSGGSVFSGGGEGGVTDGPRRDPVQSDLLGRKPVTDR
jgi:hypothetical protein